MEQYKGRANALVVCGKRVLMVKHRADGEEYWVLPGGGIEDGETPEQAAVRELKEECGINGSVLRFAGYFARSTATAHTPILSMRGSRSLFSALTPGLTKLIGSSWEWLGNPLTSFRSVTGRGFSPAVCFAAPKLRMNWIAGQERLSRRRGAYNERDKDTSRGH